MACYYRHSTLVQIATANGVLVRSGRKRVSGSQRASAVSSRCSSMAVGQRPVDAPRG